MAILTRIDPISQDVDLILREDLSPQAQTAALAEFAAEEIENAKEINRSALGRVPQYKTFVDGSERSDLKSVRPDSVVFTEFDLFNDLLTWIGEQIEKHSPVKSGRYSKSHAVFADGQVVVLGQAMPDASEFVFMNLALYARKIERGESSQAPDGVYQAVAVLAQRRFGNIARINFEYRTAISGNIVGGREGNRSDRRNPAIVVKLRES